MVADTDIRKGMSSSPVTKACFREVFKVFEPLYSTEKNVVSVSLFVVKILSLFLLLRFVKYFILNGHLPALIICLIRMNSSCSFSTLGLLYLFL